MKKIISLLSALALMATTFVATTASVSAEENAVSFRYDVKYAAENPYSTGSTVAVSVYCDGVELIHPDDMDAYFAAIDTVGITMTADPAYLTTTTMKIKSPLSGAIKSYDKNTGVVNVQYGTADWESMCFDNSAALVTVTYTIGKDLTSPIEINLSECNVNVGHFDENVSIVGGTFYGQAGVEADEVLVVPTLTVGPEATEPDPEPADPNKTAITSTFTATTTDYVEVVLEDGKDVEKATNSYALPQGVKNGEAIVAGILKYTVDAAGQNGVAPVAGDVFKVYVKSIADSAKAVLILTEEVK